MKNRAKQLFEQAIDIHTNGELGRAFELYDECLCENPPAWIAMQCYCNLALLIAELHCNVEKEQISIVEIKWMKCALGFAERCIEIFEHDLHKSNLNADFTEVLRSHHYQWAKEFIELNNNYGASSLVSSARAIGNNREILEQEMAKIYIRLPKCLGREIVFNEIEDDEIEGGESELDAELINLSEPVKLPSFNAQQKEETIHSTLKSKHITEIISQVNNLIFTYETGISNYAEIRARELAKTEQKYKKTYSEISQIVEENKKSASQILSLLQNYESSALKHLEQQKVSTIFNPSSLLPPSTAYGNSIEIAQQCVDNAHKAHQTLQLQTMPKNLTSIVLTFLGIGFFLGICGAIGSNSGGAFMPSLIFFGGTGAVIAGFLWRQATSRMQKLYADILDYRQKAVSALENHERVLQENFQTNEAKARNVWAQENSQIEDDYKSYINKIISDVNSSSQIIQNSCSQAWDAAAFAAIPWDQKTWLQWQVPERNGYEPSLNVAFGKLLVDSHPEAGIPISFKVPALLSLNRRCGLMIKAPGRLKNQAISAAQSVMLRLLATLPPGMVRFTMIDPAGLGQNVAAFMPLGKFDDKLITSRAWSEPKHIEEKLEKLTLHLQDVIQMRLRNEHKNIEEYNLKSKVPEPYHIITVMDFPVNFRDDSIRRLISIAENGARCGVYPICVVDTDLLSKNTPYNFNLANLEQHLEVIEYENGNFVWKDSNLRRWRVELDRLNLEQQKDLVNNILAGIGKKAVKAMTVEVPFDELLDVQKPTLENLWQNKATTKDFIEIPLGPQNVEENQLLTFGKAGTAHHAIIIGRTGSGKTNLMDVIITASALKYSPDEIEFYLIDLKSGVGFKPYADARLPHARVIAIDSEREFALSVLRGLIAELGDRSKSFRSNSVDNIKDYRSKTGGKMTRILLVVDEFQNLFLEDDQISRESSAILERLAREGRSFGIHILLGSQSLAGKASNLSGATLGQFAIRIALMCSESDARAIMADDNPEARLLSRPGEAIFNDRNGLIEGNKRFQVALFKDEVRQKYLGMIAAKAKAEDLRKPTVFEGNKLAQLEESEPLKKLLQGEWQTDIKRNEAWLGEPIKLSNQPVAVRFRRQAGNNLLVVAKEENEGVGMLASSWLSLALQHQPNAADFFTLNLTNSEECWFDLLGDISEMLPHKVEKLNRHNLVEKLQILTKEINLRMNDSPGDGKAKYLLVFGLQRAKDLRTEEVGSRFNYSSEGKEPSAAELFAKILREGPEAGVHVLTWCDLASNVKRTLDRKSINEFNSRAATMMSQDDSQFILDNAAASRLDRPHRAIFYDEDRPGYLEKFRPFAIPTDKSWWLEMTKNLNAFHDIGKTV